MPPSPSDRETPASDVMLTTEARSLASWPSGRSGWLRYSSSVTTSPSTESPRNSRRSLVGSPPFSYANERWVSASPSSPSDSSMPRASRSQAADRSACAVPPGASGSTPSTVLSGVGSDREDLTAGVLAAVRARHVRGLELAAGAVRARRQRRGRGLPHRAAHAGVGAGRLPLRDSHGQFSSVVVIPPGVPGEEVV